MVASTRTAQHKKRHGKHQKQTKDFLRVYLPYVPLFLIVLTGLVFTTYSHPRSRHGVLAYATSMSISSLLSSTNQQRAGNGAGALTVNSQLNQAAQAKANDMAARSYWSHNTPDGNPPWTFIDNAGYSYKKAGENLAYGFATSEDTITGWMNSPSHKENLINVDFSEVGFGFANASDFNYLDEHGVQQNTGNETIVVAMYASPLTASAPSPVAATPKAPAKSQTKAAEKTVATAPATEAAPAAAEPEAPAAAAPTAADKEVAKPVTTDTPLIKEPEPKKISRLAALTGDNLPWLTSFATLIAVAGGAILVLKHGLALRKIFVRGERYVLHHVLFDVTIASLIGLCVIVSQTAGVIR